MIKNKEWVTVHKEEQYGESGHFGIEIRVAAKKLPDLDGKEIRSAVYDASDLVQKSIKAAIKKNDPKTAIQTFENRKLVEMFPGAIFVDEIQNGYCKDWCCSHLPWFIVTTKIGRFKIGWRKRVINIDWSETEGTHKADDLFSSEDVTKGEKSIHAWSFEKAQEYISRITSCKP